SNVVQVAAGGSRGYRRQQRNPADEYRGKRQMADYKLFINGDFVDAQSGETFATYNPATGQKLADVPKAGKEDAIKAVEAARKAFDEGPWPRMSGAERAAKMRRIVELINENAAELA